LTLKYQEVALNLADKIKAHEYDKKLPSEGKLMEEYSVSRNTIRNALNVLYNQGLLRRIQGSGYFINHPLHNQANIVNMANKNGLHDLEEKDAILSEILVFETILAGEAIGSYLKIDSKDPVYHIKRIRRRKDELVSLEESFYRKDVVPYLTEEICNKSISAFIKKHFQVTSKTADEYMSLHRLNEEEAELTGKDVGSSAFMLEEINCQKNEQPYNYSKTLYFLSDLTFYSHISNYLD
jgi:GntR family transcriptional regulator of bglA